MTFETYDSTKHTLALGEETGYAKGRKDATSAIKRALKNSLKELE